MNELEFEQFLARAIEDVQSCNDRLESRYGLGHYARWDHDGVLERLTFSNPDDPEIVLAATTPIGSYSLKTQTWLWAWANQSLTEAAREKALALKGLYEKTGMRVFLDPHLDCDEQLAWELAAAGVSQLDGVGCYRGPAGHLWIFWCLDTVEEDRRSV